MADMTPGEANAAGLGWVDKNNPNYGKAGFVGSTPATGAPAPGAAGAPAPAPSPGSGTPGMPGVVDPALKNPAPSAAQPLQPSPSPQIGMGNTIDQTGQQRVQAPGLQSADPYAGMTREQYEQANPGGVQHDMQYRGPGGASGQPPNPQAEMQNALRGQIMGMLGQNVNNASVTDADIAPESRAFAGAQERYGAARRAELAQQASHEGGGGWLDQRLDKLSQDTGQAVGANDAALVARKLEGRKAQLQSAMQAAQAMGMAEEANNLQRQIQNLNAQVTTRGQDVSREQNQITQSLGNLDASTRIYLGDLNAKMQAEGLSSTERLAKMENEMKKYGIDVSGKLGMMDNALREMLGNKQIGLGYDQLGMDAAKTQAQMNRDAVMAGMG